MFKRVEPIRTTSLITSTPHCDPRVLHAPGECRYCDEKPTWQELRVIWGIAFTGYEPEKKELPDPATYARGAASLNAWPGNVATKQ